MLAPINKVPREILALVPDFLDTCDRNKGVIALTHVCRAWREVFVSRASLWSDFNCWNEERTKVYFERSKSSPINLSLDLIWGNPPCDSFFQIIPHATRRLKSLFIMGPLGSVEVKVLTRVASCLSHPAPLLEHLSIRSDHRTMPAGCSALLFALFNGDLSSLRTLRLEAVDTEYPWRNMLNLTSFTLYFILPGVASIGKLLDFFKNAPCLEEIKLCFAIPTAGAQNRRVVSLECLKSMEITDDDPSALLNHLLIPVGAKLGIQAQVTPTLIGGCLPRSLDNLKNFSNFTTIRLHCTDMEFSGPNGQVNITPMSYGGDPTELTLRYLAQFDTSKTERLEIEDGYLPSKEPLYQALLPMKDLRTLKLSRCTNPDIFICALQPATSSLEAMVCPKLEKIILVLPFEETFDVTNTIEMAAARASRGKKLRTIGVIDGRGGAELDVSELRKHVWNVEYRHEV